MSAVETNKKLSRKKLSDLFHEPVAVEIERALMHQSFQVPGAGQETTISCHRPGMRNLRLVYHPGYGLIGFHNDKYFLAPGANVAVAYE